MKVLIWRLRYLFAVHMLCPLGFHLYPPIELMELLVIRPHERCAYCGKSR